MYWNRVKTIQKNVPAEVYQQEHFLFVALSQNMIEDDITYSARFFDVPSL